MEYIDRVTETCQSVGQDVPVPSLDVLRLALSEKQPPALRRSCSIGVFDDYGQSSQIEISRRVGGAIAHFVVASYIAAKVDGNQSLCVGALPECDRSEVFATIARDSLPGSPDRPILSYGVDLHGILARAKQAERTTFQRELSRQSYYNVLPGSFPPKLWDDNPAELPHDVTLTQAFGRNTIPDKQLGDMIADFEMIPDKQLRDMMGDFEKIPDKQLGDMMANFEKIPGDVARFEWLHSWRYNFDPGLANKALADKIAEQLDNEETIVEQIMQWEVAYALWSRYPDHYKKHELGLHVLWPDEGAKSFRTFEVKRDSVKKMRELGLYNPWELAHPDMMPRALGILAKLGVEADALLIIDRPYDKDMLYDKHSVQPMTRGKSRFMLWELLARLEHLMSERVLL